ncbi:MAG: ATP-binding cassette domain-containing protein, partial [Thermoguttaceae bacterium]|nr:ATP-binding cassette domain-containing protein [Thermoguttaceae bacterium]
MTMERNEWDLKSRVDVRNSERAAERAVVLKAEGLVKIYGTRRVVDGVSFEVREGEVVGLLGANGAGKTTSFRMSCGLIPANEGKITLNGLDVTSWPMYRRAREGRLGYLPQDRSVFGTLTTEQNLIAAMEFLGYSRAEQKVALEESLEKFNLKHIRRTKVGMGGSGGLSGGERRRL